MAALFDKFGAAPITLARTVEARSGIGSSGLFD